MKLFSVLMLLGLAFFQQQNCNTAFRKTGNAKPVYHNDTSIALGGCPTKLLFPNTVKHS